MCEKDREVARVTGAEMVKTKGHFEQFCIANLNEHNDIFVLVRQPISVTFRTVKRDN